MTPKTASTRLDTTFADLAHRDRAAFIPFLSAGYPSPNATPRLLATLAAAGADVIELGVPFSDPLADGPTIQHSSQVALEAGTTLEWTLDLIARVGGDLPPIVLFSYLNPVLRFGVDHFLNRAVEAGVAGLLLTDLPVGSWPELEGRLAGRRELDLIALIAPTTAAARIDTIAGNGSGFLYYISRLGVTGARDALDERLASGVERLRDRVRLPVAVGFGISRTDQARQVGQVADGVVIGSALIAALGNGEAAFADLASGLGAAVRTARE